MAAKQVTAVVLIGVTAVLFALGIGVLIGYFSHPCHGSAGQWWLAGKCGTDYDPGKNPEILKYMDKVAKPSACAAATCDLPYPSAYITHHLAEGENITVDGKLDDPAWENVPWAQYRDIRVPSIKPTKETKAKIRWDDQFLYVGAYFEEDQIWANKTIKDSAVYLDNAFEIFVDCDSSNHWYKEFQINAIKTTWDLMMSKPYMNGGGPDSSWEMPGMQIGLYIDGTVNVPTDIDRYWSIELALPFSSLIQNTTKTAAPRNGDQWRINLSRVQYEVIVADGKYHKKPGTDATYWTWSPQYAVNLHLPERYGWLEFSTGKLGGEYSKHPNWVIYQGLRDIYEAEYKFKAINGMYIDDMGSLDLPVYLMSGKCTQKPNIELTAAGFNATLEGSQATGHVDQDRFVWFS